jgi:hypothetical protein
LIIHRENRRSCALPRVRRPAPIPRPMRPSKSGAVAAAARRWPMSSSTKAGGKWLLSSAGRVKRSPRPGVAGGRPGSLKRAGRAGACCGTQEWCLERACGYIAVWAAQRGGAGTA